MMSKIIAVARFARRVARRQPILVRGVAIAVAGLVARYGIGVDVDQVVALIVGTAALGASSWPVVTPVADPRT